MSTPPTTPPLPSWANKAQPGAPAPGSPADQQLAAFIGPRWETYRRKFRPFFEDPRFTPTWNWAAALLTPGWFLYRKLYLPFVLFSMLPGLAFGLLWRSGDLPFREVPNPSPGQLVIPQLTDQGAIVMFAVAASVCVLAGGTANYLLYRRAAAAMRVVTARVPAGDAALALLRKVGGTSWAAVGIGLAVMFVFRLATSGAVR
jgi:hypothetical protein